MEELARMIEEGRELPPLPDSEVKMICFVFILFCSAVGGGREGAGALVCWGS
jgi:hypothetical protein